ncbi:MAG TPA: Hpt domain-containing protein [Reyranella sp.]|nr:Hpt domain-containing protein [Reyranella sp.]
MVAVARVTDCSAPAIDVQHLSRMTLGEYSLQCEVLALFGRQADILLPRMRHGAPPVAASLAHTLKGSALCIGAFGVARAAEAVEQSKDVAVAAAIETLAAVLEEAKAEIARLLQTS